MATLIEGERWRGKQGEVHKLLLASGTWVVTSYPKFGTIAHSTHTTEVAADNAMYYAMRSFGGRPKSPVVKYTQRRTKLANYRDRCGEGSSTKWCDREITKLTQWIDLALAMDN